MRSSRVRVTTAAEASAREQAAIQDGAPSFTLMLRAGTRATEVLLRDYADRMQEGVAIHAGVGNNGGDAYIIAAQLARVGVKVRLHAVSPPRTVDARRAAALAAPSLVFGAPSGREQLVVDGVLGTGHRGALRADVRRACELMQLARERGALIAALDLPSGLDATSGDCAEGSVAAHVSLTFGTIKRGLLRARAHAGRVVLLDIGLEQHAFANDGAWIMADAPTIALAMPSAAWDAHKGSRGHLALVGGDTGMAGAIVLASRAALAAGAGLIRAWVNAPGVSALQQAVPQAIARAWPEQLPADDQRTPRWGNALAIGPGLGTSATSRALLQHVLRENAHVPIVFDADALTLLANESGESGETGESGAAATLRGLSTDHSIVCTPHVGEFARLLGHAVPSDWQARADALQAFAVQSGAVMLLKGTPTLIATPDAAPLLVVARGNALLATGGSGDLLTGIIGALLGQGLGARDAALLGATAHGLAAEIATTRAHGVRGLTLDAVLQALPDAWRAMEQPVTFPRGVLADLPAP